MGFKRDNWFFTGNKLSVGLQSCFVSIDINQENVGPYLILSVYYGNQIVSQYSFDTFEEAVDFTEKEFIHCITLEDIMNVSKEHANKLLIK